jgi:CRISPR-associated protein Cas2
MNEERFMRVFVFFDLPTNTKKERKAASQFRNRLIKEGFMMLQYSIYIRVCKGQDMVSKTVTRVKERLPKSGNIRILQVTEKQYLRMETLLGIEKKEEKLGNRQLLLF